MEDYQQNQISYSQQPMEDVPLDGNLLHQISKNMSFIGIFSIVAAVMIVLFVVYFLFVVNQSSRFSMGYSGKITVILIGPILIAILLFISGIFLRKGKDAFEKFFMTSSILDFHNGIDLQIKYFSIYIALLSINILIQIIGLVQLL